MAEYAATSVNPIGNFNGHCSISLDGAAITVKRPDGVKIASWPYNCIRQFRAEDQHGKFSFISGRRGPFGVAEYIFSLSASPLAGLQEALTQFTGAQFSDMGSNTKQRPASTSSLRDRSHGIRLESATSEHSKSFDSVFSPSHSRMQSSRSPKPSTSDSDVFSAGSTYDIPRARPHLATSDTIPESSPYSPPTVPKRSSFSPKEAWVLNSQSYESLPGKGKPKVPTKPRPLQSTKGSFHGQNALYDTSVLEQTTTGGSPSGHRRLSPDQDDVSRDGARSTSPKRLSPDSRLSPQSSITHEDLPSQSLIKQPSEISLASVSIRRRTHDYEDADISPKQRNVRKSDPGSHVIADPTYDHLPKSKRVSEPGGLEESGKHTVVVKKLAELTCQNPEAPELLFGSPDSCSNLDLLPRSSAQAQLIGRQSSEHGKQRAYTAHPRELGSQSPEEDYDVPRSALYSSPRAPIEDRENVYNVPRSLQESEDDSLYKVPKRLSGVAVQDSVYSAPRPCSVERDDTYNVPRRRSDGNVHSVKAASSLGDLLDDSHQMNYDVPPSRLPPDDTAVSASRYNAQRKAPRHVRREKAYEDIDFPPRKNGKMRPSRSFESLFNRRITPLPNLPRTFSPPNLPSPTSKGVYIDIDLLERERRGESLYAEISEKPQPRYVTSPRRSPLPPIPKTTPPSPRKFPPTNSVPESPSSALYATIPGDDYKGPPQFVSNVKLSNAASSVPVANANKETTQDHELYMPADENVPSLPPRSISPPQNTPQSSCGPVTEKYGHQLPNGLQRKPFADTCLKHATRPTESPAVFQPTSGPFQSCPLTDEYVIITKSDPRDRSEPQNIPRMGLASRPVQQGMDDFEMMRPAQLASIRGRKSPSPNPGTKGNEDYDFPTQWNNSPYSSMSSPQTGSNEGIPRNHSFGSLPRGVEKMQLTSSVSSQPPFATMPRRRMTSGDSSDSGPFSPPHAGSVPIPPRKLVKVASGSPSDRRPSTELRSKTRSLGIMLNVDKHTYVNVSNEQGPSPKQRSTSQSAEKKPVPVPRSALLRTDIP